MARSAKNTGTPNSVPQFAVEKFNKQNGMKFYSVFY
jgi:hypothetical protein